MDLYFQDPTYDEYCDPRYPRRATYEDVLAASRRILGAVLRTPCGRANLAERFGIDLYVKLETRQFTGSFKERGARNVLLLLTDEQKKYGVIAASTGNHAAAMSYHAMQLGIPISIVMPGTASVKKVANVEQYGVKVTRIGKSLKDCEIYAKNLCRENRMTYINGYDHLNMIEGHGTIGIEIFEQIPNVEFILCPVGGGGLIAGVAAAIKHLKPTCKVYGFSTDRTCSMAEAFRKNERVTIDIGPTLADALAVNTVGVNSFATIRNGLIDKMVVVKEDWVARAILVCLEHERIIIEGAAATTIAAIMAGLVPELQGKRVVTVITGGNIDSAILQRTVKQAMAGEGRLIKFNVDTYDQPGSMARLCAVLANLGVTIRNIFFESNWSRKAEVYNIVLKVVAETRGWEHRRDLEEKLKESFDNLIFDLSEEKPEKAIPPKKRYGVCPIHHPKCIR